MMIPDLEPMLATSGIPLGGLDGWAAEPKWDGWRARVTVGHGKAKVRSRTGRVITSAVPDLAAFGAHDAPAPPRRGARHRRGRLADFYGAAAR